MEPLDLGPRYEYLRELGSGGAGRVMLVRDRHRQADVALKVLHEARPESRELDRFRTEFEVLSRLEHPGIARAHDFGYLEDRPFYSSEYVRGAPLRRNGADAASVCRSLLDVCEAMAFLHARGILHLDIKPSNIIATDDIASDTIESHAERRHRLVLIDFGLCRSDAALRVSQSIRGSLRFMGPEFFDARELGPWTDVYAFGVTAYLLATGRYPRSGAAALAEGAHDGNWVPVPRPPSLDVPDLEKDVDGVLLRCLSIDPSARFADGAEVHRALRAALGSAVERGPDVAQRSAVAVSRARQVATFGRQLELDAGERFLDGVAGVRPARAGGATSPGRMLLVTGPPGIGQSHFLSELKTRAQTRGIHLYLEAAYAGGIASPGAILRCLCNHMPRDALTRWQSFVDRLGRPRPWSRGAARGAGSDDEARWSRGGAIARALRAVREPLVLAIDRLELFDEVSIALVLEVVRFLETRPDETVVSAIIGCREEGPAAPLLAELTRRVLRCGTSELITLRALDPRETLELHRFVSRALGGSVESPDEGLALFQRTGGVPARVVAAASVSPRGEEGPEGGQGAATRTPAPSSEARLARTDEALLLALELLRRPATSTELARYVELSRDRTRRRLLRLLRSGLVLRVASGSAAGEWVASPGGSRAVAGKSESLRQRMHRALAKALLRASRNAADSRRRQAVYHARLGGLRSVIVRHGPEVATYLAETLQTRAALDLLESVLEFVPRSRSSLRTRVVLDMAALEARLGKTAAGIERLRAMLAGVGEPSGRRPAGQRRVRLLLNLAMLHARSGDFRQADALFAEGLAAGRARLRRDEHLYFLNEHAAMKAFVGEHDRALALCDEGLRLAGDSTEPAIRDVALNFYATRANVALRTFRFDDAAKDFETAFDIAEALGSHTNRAVILNNLGIVNSQRERFAEAVRAFQEAEKTCERLGEGPSLTAIYGNLALLHSKLGAFDAADEALRKAESLTATTPTEAPATATDARGRREAFFLEHHRGLALLSRGRLCAARGHLERAIALSQAMGDGFVVDFDRLYRAEALIFEAAYADAATELAALRKCRTIRVRRMALCRQAFLAALSAQEPLRRRCERELESLAAGRPVPFLDAWDDVFIAWACSLGGEYERAQSVLARAGAYFRRHGLAPAASLVAIVDAESMLLAGDVEAAERAVESIAPQHELVAVLLPLLRCRLSLERPATRAAAAAHLAEASSALVGRRLPEWRLRADALCAALRGDASAAVLAELGRRRAELARELPAAGRRGFAASTHWRRWTHDAFELCGETCSGPDSRTPGPAPGDSPTTSDTVTLEGRLLHSLEGNIVARSPAMRSLVESIEKLAASDLPVVITGESGAGKELVARSIHAASARGERRFGVLDCGTIPEGLIEVELFGARAGAFTDLAEDRPGLLRESDLGTVLIEGITRASLEIQAKLLRVLADKVVRPLGSSELVSIDVRFLFSSTGDLETEACAGRLRVDLLHRINVLRARVPALRERREDIAPLVELLLRDRGAEPPTLERGVVEHLETLPWPGNVRELGNVLWRLRLEHPRRITLAAARTATAGPESPGLVPRAVLARTALPELKEGVEREYVLYHLRRLGGDVAALSQLLGIGVKHCYRRCKQLGIRVREERARDAERPRSE